MRSNRFFLWMTASACGVLLAACGAAADPAVPANSPTAAAESAAVLPSDSSGQTGEAASLPAGDLSADTQLAVGLLKLEGTPLAVTAEQAAQMLPLWQMLRALQDSDSAAQAERDAVLEQLRGCLTADQIQAIAALQLTQADVMAAMQEMGPQTAANAEGTPMPRIGQGGQPGNGPGGGMGGGPPGEAPGGIMGGGPNPDGQGMEPGFDPQTTAAPDESQRGNGNGTGVPRFLINVVIRLLETRSAGG